MKWFYTLAVSFLLIVSTARALTPQGLDAKAEVSGQTYPLGGLLTGTVGYSKGLWKEAGKENEKDFWQYGYMRGMAELKTAGLINRLTAAVEVYPISILGLSVGGGTDLRNYNKFTDFDCGSLMCDQSLNFQFAQARLIVGYEKLLGVITARYDQYRAETGKQDFYDEMSYLVGRKGQDDLRTLNVLALYRQDDTWAYGVLALYQQFIFSQSNSSSVFALVNYTEGPWRASLGAGEFHSSHQGQKPSLLFSLQYTGIKGMGLLD
jgi:hypothetical protein